ncbi:hypothetical protein K488DRAFT_82398 [Vararia minispora EC-137]|uniref:Uncharacterized protein n=1 Tax=Vararia minispora EC-137 TaxID=1314806 RepID=A0ACB8QWU8_9AGAM|nr:hypothetical protein K488DRAFT_82398 [Vararia minispora EC-137]
MATKNRLDISLTESVVFLRGVDFSGRPHVRDSAPPAILRGLLTLELVKPTRITSIEVELQGKASTTLPDPSVGTRRAEVIEEHKIYSATQTFFRASDPAPAARRALSVDPGLHLYRDDVDTHERDPAPEYESVQTPSYLDALNERGRARERRRQSADFSIHQTDFVLHAHEHEHSYPSPPLTFPNRDSDASVSAHAHTSVYTPERTPPVSPASFTPIVGAAPHDTFALPPTNLEYEARSVSASPNHSRTPSRPPSRTPSRARSRTRPGGILTASVSGLSSHSSHSHSRDNSVLLDDEQPPPLSRSQSGSDSLHAHASSPLAWSHGHAQGHASSSHGHAQPSSPVAGREASESRGRSTRFSFAAVSSSILDAVKERVRSSSPAVVERGRAKEKSPIHTRENGGTEEWGARPRRQGEEEAEEGGHHKEFGNGWKEFKKGTYTFPISFSIPSHLPPTFSCTYGTVSWRLKAHVHRPGVLTVKMSATTDVTVVATPADDDTEDSENIVVERLWDNQLQYLFTVAGRMFSIGGVVPIDMTFLPMAKMKVIRLSAHVEERVEYFIHHGRVSRSEAAQLVTLLDLRHDKNQPILPLDPSLLSTTPLRRLIPAADDDSSATQLMGLGPWVLSAEVRLPTTLHPSNRNKRANMVVTHSLKIVMRVERGDDLHVDAKTGKRKQFEIVVHAPVHLLSPLADMKYTALPRYCERGRARVPQGTAESAAAAAAATGPLAGRHERYERLITGQESEVGEAPPAYTPKLDALDELEAS